jgi:hypothetical protein
MKLPQLSLIEVISPRAASGALISLKMSKTRRSCCRLAGDRCLDLAQSGALDVAPCCREFKLFERARGFPMMVTAPTLSISPEKVCFFILKAREFDVKDAVSDPDSGSNASDDAMIDVLEDHPDDPTQQELRSFIDALTEDEQVDLVALTWLGRGDGTIDEWDDLRAEAARLHNNRTAAYLMGKPMLGDHLEEGLSQFGLSCEDFQPR